MALRKTNGEFINESNKIFKCKYVYDLCNYVSNKVKVNIRCLEHGIFTKTPSNHLRGQGCPKCMLEKISSNNIIFIDKAKIKHNNLYTYENVKYVSNKIKVDITCIKHGSYKQSPNTHLSGQGCPTCSKRGKLTSEIFINRGLDIHNSFYDYKLVCYVNIRTKIDIICPIHGIFKQSPEKHILRKQGCPKCKSSKGERAISKYLDKINIEYITEHKFHDLGHKRFDFYLPSLNICIEYDGRQHFESIKHFGGEKQYLIQIESDKIKDKYCLDNGINIIRIPYWDFDNIEDILKNIN
jgi:very-short-patch-repair endonuclease